MGRFRSRVLASNAISRTVQVLRLEHVEQRVVRGSVIEDDVAFTRAGIMHNFSYLGGLLGVVSGCSFLVIERRLARKAETP